MLEKSESQTISKPDTSESTERGYVYRCPKACPLRKKCFVLKTAAALPYRIGVWQKCAVTKSDIRITIGDGKPP